MRDNRYSPINYSLFVVIWSIATLSHQFFYGVIFSSPFDLLLTILALATILRPANYNIFLAQVFVQCITIFLYLPNVYNHWFLAFIVSSTVLINYLKIIFTEKSLKTTSKELYNNFAPALRIVLIVVYVSAFIHKLNTDYLAVDVSCGVVMYSRLTEIFSILPDSIFLGHIAIYISLLLEISIPLLLIFRRTRLFGILLGLYTHMIFGFAGFGNFSLIMYALLFLYTLTFLMVSIYVAGSLKNINTLLQIGIIVHSVVSMIIILTFIRFCNFGSNSWAENLFKLNYPNIVILIIVILNSLSPYMGLKTENVFSMYSNLRTENYRSNHYLFKNSSLFANYQNDTVIISETNINELKNNRLLIHQKLKNFMFKEYMKGEKNFYVNVVKNGIPMSFKYQDIASEGKFLLNYLKWKFLTFKAISLDEKQRCGL